MKIIAYLNSFPRIKPLLWNLNRYKLKEKFEFILLDCNKEDYKDKILEQLNLFRSCFKWSYYKEDEAGEIIDDEILFLPANCIPYKDSINILIEENCITPICLRPGALFSYITDEYSSNTTDKMINDCNEENFNIYINFCGKKTLLKTCYNSKFIINECLIPTNFKLAGKLIEKNYD